MSHTDDPRHLPPSPHDPASPHLATSTEAPTALAAAGRRVADAITATMEGMAHALLRRADLPDASAVRARFAALMWRATVALTRVSHGELPARLSTWGLAVCCQYSKTYDRATLHQAIAIHRDAVSRAADSPDLGMCLTNLSTALSRCAEADADEDAAYQAVLAARQAADLPVSNIANKAGRLSNLGVMLQLHYELSAQSESLDEAVTALYQAVATCPDGHPALSGWYANLAGVLQTRHERWGESDDLDGAVEAARRALAEIDDDDPSRADRLGGLAAALHAAHDHYGTATALDEAVTLLEEATSAGAALPESQHYLWGSLSVALRRRHELTGRDIDLTRAADAAARAVDADGVPGQDRAARLAVLCNIQRTVYERGGDREILAAALRSARQAMEASPASHIDHTVHLSNLANTLATWSERTGDTTALHEALRLTRQASARTPVDHLDHADRLADLASLEIAVFQRTGAEQHLEEALSAARQAVDQTSEQDPKLPRRLTCLTVALRLHYERWGGSAMLSEARTLARRAVDMSDAAEPGRLHSIVAYAGTLLADGAAEGRDVLETAASQLQHAVRLLAAESPERPAVLRALANTLLALFSCAGQLACLTDALGCAREALAGLPARHPDRSDYLVTLADALATRYEATGDHACLDEALEAAGLAVRLCPRDHPALPYHQALLANMRHTRALVSKSIPEMRLAADDMLLALRQVPEDMPQRWIFLNNVAIVQNNLATMGAAIDAPALAQATAMARAALAALPPGHPEQGMILANLSATLLDHPEAARDAAVLHEARTAAARAVHFTPLSNPDRCRYLMNLGQAWRAEYRRCADPHAAAAALTVFREASAAPAGAPSVRVQAGIAWGALAASTGDWSEAINGYDSAIGLLPHLSSQLLTRLDQQRLLADVNGLGRDAAACAVRLGDPRAALRIIEKGRGVLLAQRLGVRTILAQLKRKAPNLVDRYESLTAQFARLDRATTPTRPQASGFLTSDAVNSHWRETLARQWNELINEMAAVGIPETEEPSTNLDAAVGDAFVVINPSSFGSHAIVVTSTDVSALSLPDLSLPSLRDQLDRFLDAFEILDDELDGHPHPLGVRNAQTAMSDVLGWLWDVLAEPVLDALGHTRTPADGEVWPRVWWSPTGPLSLLPLHAAGRHAGRPLPGPAVLDRVVSSYAPTLLSLQLAQTRRESAGPAALVTVAPTLSERDDLPRARREARQVAHLFPGNVTELEGGDVTTQSVLSELPLHPWVHFACHGILDFDDPSLGGLVVASDHPRLLTVRDVDNLRLPAAELAYLAACDSASISTLPDEAIHLASAFHIAGYRHVIATLWATPDRVASRFAAHFYDSVTQGGTVADSTRSSYALHCATRAQRDRFPGHPALWAGHIHVGV